MRFLGGKARIAREIARVMLRSRTSPGTVVYEPFMGMLNVTVELLKQSAFARVVASDLHEDLVDMWLAIQAGWSPPAELTEARYEELRESAPSPERTFAGYGCSFAGKWFGGFAAGSGRNYASEAARSVEKVRPLLPRITFRHGGYQDQDIPPGQIVYCDPPYENTTKPGARNDFDHAEFWKWVASYPGRCYVSEYQAPPEFRAVWQKRVVTDMHTKSGKSDRVERLFVNQ